MEQQAEDHANQCSKGHAFQSDAAQLNGNARQTNDQNNRSQYCVSCSAVINLRIYQNTQTGSADHTIQQEGDTANNSTGNGIDEGSQFADKGAAKRKHSSTTDNIYAVNFCHSHNTDVFAICSRRYGTDAGRKKTGEVIRKQGAVQTRIFDQISADNFAGYYLMTDMFRNNNQQGRQHDGNGLRMEFGGGEIWQCQPVCFCYRCEIYNTCQVCRNITADNSDQDGDN